MTVETTKTELSREEYYQLLGLRVIADRHLAALKVIEQAAVSITGEKTDDGAAGGTLTADYLWASRDLDDLLRVLKLKVVDGPQS